MRYDYLNVYVCWVQHTQLISMSCDCFHIDSWILICCIVFHLSVDARGKKTRVVYIS